MYFTIKRSTASFSRNSCHSIKGVHEGLKRHKCDICDKTYNLHSNLKQHIKLVHLEFSEISTKNLVKIESNLEVDVKIENCDIKCEITY